MTIKPHEIKAEYLPSAPGKSRYKVSLTPESERTIDVILLHRRNKDPDKHIAEEVRKSREKIRRYIYGDIEDELRDIARFLHEFFDNDRITDELGDRLDKIIASISAERFKTAEPTEAGA